jgi:hypothetical protein
MKRSEPARAVVQFAGARDAEQADRPRSGDQREAVKAHVTTIFNSLGMTDRTQAALWAREQGIE